MRKIYFMILFLGIHLWGYSQDATSLKVQDTRNVDDLPSFNKSSIRFDFKTRSVIGVPGGGTFSGNLTISPWSASSGGLNHQLNFNNGGVYYRTGNLDAQAWNSWQRVILEDNSKTILNNVQLKGRLASNDNSFTYKEKNVGHYALEWTGDTWNSAGATAYLSSYSGIKFFTYGRYRMGISVAGNVGIGVETPQARLHVDGAIKAGGSLDVGGSITTKDLYASGTIYAKSVKVRVDAGADYVFDADYKLRDLSEVEAFVKENKHLPEIQSEKDMQANGVDMNEFQIKLLQKIEELTLYTIQQNTQIKEQNNRIEQLEQKLNSKK